MKSLISFQCFLVALMRYFSGAAKWFNSSFSPRTHFSKSEKNSNGEHLHDVNFYCFQIVSRPEASPVNFPSSCREFVFFKVSRRNFVVLTFSRRQQTVEIFVTFSIATRLTFKHAHVVITLCARARRNP